MAGPICSYWRRRIRVSKGATVSGTAANFPGDRATESRRVANVSRKGSTLSRRLATARVLGVRDIVVDCRDKFGGLPDNVGPSLFPLAFGALGSKALLWLTESVKPAIGKHVRGIDVRTLFEFMLLRFVSKRSEWAYTGFIMPMTARVTRMNGKIVGEKRNGQHRVFSHDPEGNVIGVRDETGAVLATYKYWPFGGLRESTGSIENPWRYRGAWGYYCDGPSYYVTTRVFRPDLTRWTTVDSLWPLEQAYGYCSQNPTTLTDPSGRQPSQMSKQPVPVYITQCGFTIQLSCHPPDPCAVGNFCDRYVFPRNTFAVTVCCDGSHILCINKKSGITEPGVIACIRRHEEQHLKDVKCAPCGRDSNTIKDGKRTLAWYFIECRGSIVGYNCLIEGYRNCTTQQCRSEYLKLLRIECQNIFNSCGESGNNPYYQARKKFCESIGAHR